MFEISNKEQMLFPPEIEINEDSVKNESVFGSKIIVADDYFINLEVLKS